MSLQKLTKLQDLKNEVDGIFKIYDQKLTALKSKSIKNLLTEMRTHLEENGFKAVLREGGVMGFTATYHNIDIGVEASPVKDRYFQWDYVVTLTSGNKKAEVMGDLVRNPIPQEPKDTDIDSLIKAYEINYLPALKEFIQKDLCEQQNLTFKVTNTLAITAPTAIADGTQAIEKFSKLLY
ncbi:hypothetical protein [Cedecea neteri]|uniref:hypothetical protein n=1 Tax=Cedecea neteri TaxID=158822 RepID=UPI00289CF610|nr:hypothetical protein [Cedecea neteri]